jgi:hypothetical protein
MKLEDVCSEVAGLVPVYSDAGNTCRIICRSPADGNVYSFSESRSVEGVKRILARCCALDLTAQARRLQKEYHRCPPVPFYFPDGRIFVPFKLRLARITGDASYGYIELGIINRIVPGKNGRCQIELINNEALPVCSHITTARLALYFGLEIQKANFKLQPDPDQELLLALRILRRYFGSGSPAPAGTE